MGPKTSKSKDTSSVLKNITKWNAKAQELNININPNRSEPKTEKTEKIEKTEKTEKIEILNKPVPALGEKQAEPEVPSYKDEITASLKAKYEAGKGSICMLCKRQLGTNEKLLVHYQLSELHAKNFSAELERQAQKNPKIRASLDGREEPSNKKPRSENS